MADADENRRTARPTGGPNPAQLTKAQNKYKVFDRAASIEYERLFGIDTKKKLNPNSNAAEHSIVFHLCTLRDGIDFQMILFECFQIYLIKCFSEWQDISFTRSKQKRTPLTNSKMPIKQLQKDVSSIHFIFSIQYSVPFIP
jgi:hypothetical protein